MLIHHFITVKALMQPRCGCRCLSTVLPGGRSPLADYRRRVGDGSLTNDAKQLEVVQHLDRLYFELRAGYRPSPAKPGRSWGSSLLSMMFQKVPTSPIQPLKQPRGIYIYGIVGCGKTMLMDLLYDCCDFVTRKERIHFHAFMQRVHKEMHKFKVNFKADSGESYDPIPPVARSISEKTWLLCFDEFQVTDIADAMILKRLFTELFHSGVVIVATSNRRPDNLYKRGLQRANFIPFIDVLKHYCESVCLDSSVDYRTAGLSSDSQHYFVLKDHDCDSELDNVFKALSSKENDTVRPRTVNLLGRHITLPKTCGQVLDAQFSDLCEKALGAADYIALCQIFHTVILRDVPVLRFNNLSAARRLITLIDTLYEFKVRLVCSAEDYPYRLFRLEDKGHEQLSDQQRELMDELNIVHSKEKEGNSSANLFTGSEEQFAFDRTVSRLREMQSDRYWQFRDKSWFVFSQ